ncbi:MAG: serine/threonine-protein kinase [Planctomycetota bacterium]
MHDELIGKQFGPDGRYLIRRHLGSGGSGHVYEAYEERKDRSVAVKFLSEGTDDAEVIRRFKLEGQKFSAIRHPNIVRVYGMGRAAGMLYIASEFVDGENLWDFFRARGRLEIGEALQIIDTVAGALEVAHDLGVIHRDLKPENVMIDREGVVKVLDFGIAKDLNASVALTIKGAYLGTAGYSAPEQIRGQEIDARADIFSLGVMLYELVTGEPPFKGRRTTDVLENTVKADPVNPTRFNEEVSSPVAKLIARMIAKKKRARMASCAEVRSEIAAVQAALGAGATQEDKKGIISFLKDVFDPDWAREG